VTRSLSNPVLEPSVVLVLHHVFRLMSYPSNLLKVKDPHIKKQERKRPTPPIKKRRMDYAEDEPKPSSSTTFGNCSFFVDVSHEENEEIRENGEQDSDPNLAIEDTGSDEGGGDPGKWTTKEVSNILDVYQNFKPQFNKPYAFKVRIWEKVKSNYFFKAD
jgi:hypothetical protein